MAGIITTLNRAKIIMHLRTGRVSVARESEGMGAPSGRVALLLLLPGARGVLQRSIPLRAAAAAPALQGQHPLRRRCFSTTDGGGAADPRRGGVTFDFDGKVSLVTGGASGIGRAVAHGLHAAGARVIAMDVNETALEQLKSELGSSRCSTVTADLSSDEGVGLATKQALQLAGGAVDHLVSSAGVGKMQAMMDVDIASFDLMMAVNCRAALQMSQLVARALIDRGRPGAIVHISSQSSSTAIRERCAYSLTKAGIDYLTKSMALELGPHSIRTNSVNPTVVLTALGKVRLSSDYRGHSNMFERG